MMRRRDFEERGEPRWRALEQGLADLEKGELPASEAGALPRLFRQVCADLAMARHRMYGVRLGQRLNDAVMKSFRLLYRSSGRSVLGFLRFLAIGFPRQVRQEARLFWFCSALFWGPFLLLAFSPSWDLSWIYALLGPSGMTSLESSFGEGADRVASLREEFGSDFMMFAFYVWNNVSIDFRVFAGGILAGLGTVFFTVYNGLYLGAATGYVHAACDPELFYSFVAGHSSVELIGLVIAAMAGLRLGLGFLNPGTQSRGTAIVLAARQAIKLLGGAAALTLLAAVIEGFWSAQPFPPLTKYAFGLGLWILLAVYLLLAGRGAGREA
ncbi:MAG: stage II sporulation protein M [Verrucomicrobiota bacterium]